MPSLGHVGFCRVAAAAAASWGLLLWVWPSLSAGLPTGPLPPLHARCVAVLHLSLACGLWSASRRLDVVAARLPLCLLSTWGVASLAIAWMGEHPFAGQAWLAGMVVAGACAVWWQVQDDGEPAPSERLHLGWGGLAMVAGAWGVALLLGPETVAPLWPWPMAPRQAWAYGAPLLGVGAMAALASRERRQYVREPAALVCLTLAAGFAVASCWHGPLFVATRPATWVWFGVLGAVAAWALAQWPAAWCWRRRG